MSASSQLDVLARLGYAVFERTGAGSFQWIGGASEWLPAGPLTEAFPFLEVFIPDAEAFWISPGDDSRLRSGYWTQKGPDGTELHFRAIAVSGARKLLLIELIGRRFEETRNFVQYAHEAKLAHEEIDRLNHELERATQAKSEFLARMSHEIRTPMNALLGVAELLSETPLNPEQSEYVRVFRRAGDTLLNVINDILDFSKVEAGHVELECIPFDLTEVVQGALDIIGVKARVKGLALSCEMSPDVLARRLGDPGRLRQILLNLLSNAVKFTDNGGITVRVEPGENRQAPGELHFTVTDTGVGIPPEHISTIFDSFTQADASTTRKYGGTGLGLSISKRFVELMRGRIWAESEPGRGSAIHFTARLAIADAGSEAAEPRVTVPISGTEETAHAAIRNRPMRILLADDSEDNRFLFRGYLRDTDCVIDEVVNGAEALEKFKQGGYDAILMDAEMPVLNGYSATRAIRALERERGEPPVPILALTAHALKEARDRSLAAGCTDHLTKPITKAALLDAIRRYVGEPHSAPRIHVAVEAWLKPVIPAYLEKRRADIPKLQSALQERDYATVRMLGHQMAGSGSGYGFAEITGIGSRLEESALAGDAPKIQQGIDALHRYLQNLVAD